jgi:hypothetical protein
MLAQVSDIALDRKEEECESSQQEEQRLSVNRRTGFMLKQGSNKQLASLQVITPWASSTPPNRAVMTNSY